MSDKATPYNIYSYLEPYLSGDTSLLANWYSKWGMYLTPFDSREVDRINELTDYNVKDQLRQGLETATSLRTGIGRTGFSGSYLNATQALSEDMLKYDLQAQKLKGINAQKQAEKSYSSRLYGQLGRLADLGAFSDNELEILTNDFDAMDALRDRGNALYGYDKMSEAIETGGDFYLPNFGDNFNLNSAYAEYGLGDFQIAGDETYQEFIKNNFDLEQAGWTNFGGDVLKNVNERYTIAQNLMNQGFGENPINTQNWYDA